MKRIFIWLLCVLILIQPVHATTILNKGTCGKNLSWTLDDEGTLTISGTGSMKDYSSVKSDDEYITGAEWGKSKLTKVVIQHGVTSIGLHSFYNCKGLKDITIPTSVISIGSGSFRRCTGLTEVTIPESVTSIGELAFEGCKGLKSIIIPPKVTRIGANVFTGCSSMTSVTIPSSVTTIGIGAFSGCSKLISIIIPESVSLIEQDAFNQCSGLKSIKLPSKITILRDGLFYKCSSLSDIEIPSSVTSIGNLVFYGCSNLRKITIPSSVKSFGFGVFENCSNLTIYGYPGSYAETYARTNGIPFKSVTLITPTPKPTITLDKTNLILYKGLSSKYSKATLVAEAPGPVKFKSSDKKIAKVSSKGVVTAAGKGTATITAYLASDKGVKAKCVVTVRKPVLTVLGSLKVKKGRYATIEATALPDTTIKYQSSNKKIATVDSKGVVKGKKKGSCKITLTANGVKKTVKVTVE